MKELINSILFSDIFICCVISMGIGTLVLWIVIDNIMWRILKDKMPTGRDKKWITILLGILERAIYTFTFSIGVPEWVAIWLGFKTAVSWNSRKDDTCVYNVYLIGNLLSLMFGFLGAWYYLGKVPIR